MVLGGDARVGVDAGGHVDRQHRGLRLAQPVTQLRGEAAGTADPQDTVDDEVGEVGLRQLLEDVTAGRDESVARTLVDPALPAEQHRPDIVGGGEGGPGVQGVTAVAPRADEQQHIRVLLPGEEGLRGNRHGMGGLPHELIGLRLGVEKHLFTGADHGHGVRGGDHAPQGSHPWQTGHQNRLRPSITR